MATIEYPIFSNHATTTLAADITASSTTLSCQSGDGALFPAPSTAEEYFMCTLEDPSGNIEIVKCTSRTDDTFEVLRGQEGTTALGFVTGTVLDHRLTAQQLTDSMAKAKEFRDDTEVIKGEAQAEADRAQGYASGLNLPAIEAGDGGKALKAKVDETGFELSTLGFTTPVLAVPTEVPEIVETAITITNYDSEATYEATFSTGSARVDGDKLYITPGSVTEDTDGVTGTIRAYKPGFVWSSNRTFAVRVLNVPISADATFVSDLTENPENSNEYYSTTVHQETVDPNFVKHAVQELNVAAPEANIDPSSTTDSLVISGFSIEANDAIWTKDSNDNTITERIVGAVSGNSAAAYTYYKWTFADTQNDAIHLGFAQLELLNESGTDMIPSMASASQDGYVVTKNNSVYGYEYFDDTNTTRFDSNGSFPKDIIIQLPSAQLAYGYKLTNNASNPERSPKNWTFSGSNDGTNWTVLDTQSQPSLTGGQIVTINLDVTGTCTSIVPALTEVPEKVWKAAPVTVATATSGSASELLLPETELDLAGASTDSQLVVTSDINDLFQASDENKTVICSGSGFTDEERNVTSVTKELVSGSQGQLTPVMTGETTDGVTITGGPYTGATQEAWKAFDGSMEYEASSVYGEIGGSTLFNVDFGTAVTPNQINFAPYSAGTSTYTIQRILLEGSDDNTSWTTVHDENNYTAANSLAYNSVSFSNATAYRYFRLQFWAYSSYPIICDVQIMGLRADTNKYTLDLDSALPGVPTSVAKKGATFVSDGPLTLTWDTDHLKAITAERTPITPYRSLTAKVTGTDNITFSNFQLAMWKGGA